MDWRGPLTCTQGKLPKREPPSEYRFRLKKKKRCRLKKHRRLAEAGPRFARWILLKLEGMAASLLERVVVGQRPLVHYHLDLVARISAGKVQARHKFNGVVVGVAAQAHHNVKAWFLGFDHSHIVVMG